MNGCLVHQKLDSVYINITTAAKESCLLFESSDSGVRLCSLLYGTFCLRLGLLARFFQLFYAAACALDLTKERLVSTSFGQL